MASNANEYNTPLTKCQDVSTTHECIIIQEMVKIHNGIDEVPRYKPCREYHCKHNIFSYAVRPNDKKRNLRRKIAIKKSGESYMKETERSREILNCARLITEPMTCDEVAELWSVSHQNISAIVAKGLGKLRKRATHLKDYLEE